jgi:hypothetical protein
MEEGSVKLTLTLADDKLPEVSAELADIDGSPEGVGAYLRELEAAVLRLHEQTKTTK